MGLSTKSGYTFTQRQCRGTIDGRKTSGRAAMTMCTGRRHHDFDLCHDRFIRVLPMQHVCRHISPCITLRDYIPVNLKFL